MGQQRTLDAIEREMGKAQITYYRHPNRTNQRWYQSLVNAYLSAVGVETSAEANQTMIERVR